jgi:hypothetical protein
LICLLVLLPLIKLYYSATGQHLHEEKYSTADNNAAAGELGNYLLKLANGDTKAKKSSILHRLVNELKEFAVKEGQAGDELKKMTTQQKKDRLDTIETDNPMISNRHSEV